MLNTTPMPIILENQSSGKAYFYADGKQVCIDHCIIALRPGSPQHFLNAFTYYGGAQPYGTPKATVCFESGQVHRYLACGELGSPGSNCGFF